jgi:FMN hydrolase / 5-amino-6-(5-phospho-D-ribitylamino)uracil phosphatase
MRGLPWTTARLTTLFTIGLNPIPACPFTAPRRFRYRPRKHFSAGTSVGASSSSSSAATTSSSSAEAEDLLRWEQMYAEGARSTGLGMSIEESSNSMDVSVRSKVHVITYDLDNTLWNTSATIGTANDALAAHMHLQCGDDDPAKNMARVEQRMRALHEAQPDRYGPTVPRTSTTTSAAESFAPVRLTDLRKDAIRSVLIDEAGYTDDDPRLEQSVDDAFGVWVDARHSCIPAHFAPSGVLECLKAIRQSSTDIVAIGAITDGNSNPLAIPELREYFDFCINAEQVGVGKPDRRVYQAAVKHVLEQHPWLRDKISLWANDGDDGDDGDIDAVGPWWVHVGDDFVKDVVAAKDLGMRTIWSRELLMNTLQLERKKEQTSRTRDVETFVKEISAMEVIQMQIGADDYLLESLQKEFADEIVDRFVDVAQTIDRWQTEAADPPINENYYSEESGTPTRVEKLSDSGTSAIGLPPDRTVDVLPHQEKNNDLHSEETTEEAREFKFCIFCGTKLPTMAKFCSSCGGKQE